MNENAPGQKEQDAGKDIIREIYRMRDAFRGRVAVAYLTNHDMAWPSCSARVDVGIDAAFQSTFTAAL